MENACQGVTVTDMRRRRHSGCEVEAPSVCQRPQELLKATPLHKVQARPLPLANDSCLTYPDPGAGPDKHDEDPNQDVDGGAKQCAQDEGAEEPVVWGQVGAGHAGGRTGPT